MAGTKKNARMKRRAKETVFYWSIVILPLLQFCVFYVAVNANSVILAFKSYNTETGLYSFAGFANFTAFIRDMAGMPALKTALKNSLIVWLSGLAVGLPLAQFFSFYIYKKMPLHGFFRVMLFLPSVVSAVITVALYKYFVDRAWPEAARALFGVKMPMPLATLSTRFPAILVYNVWVSFGTGILLYTGSMTQISVSVAESARLEGANSFQEYWHITLPSIWPMATTFLVVGVASIFTNQASVYTFYQDQADNSLYMFGYFLFQRVIGKAATLADYPYAAAGGIALTAIAVPLTLGAKALLEKCGPKE
ncbi:MAG: sugar ABC transporter permease [Clostridiales bacterium]|jgi:ABC-type sugar transport system permease subunit|nr:sugar ABC transporter permease [Clostridiales bacterium]